MWWDVGRVVQDDVIGEGVNDTYGGGDEDGVREREGSESSVLRMVIRGREECAAHKWGELSELFTKSIGCQKPGCVSCPPAISVAPPSKAARRSPAGDESSTS